MAYLLFVFSSHVCCLFITPSLSPCLSLFLFLSLLYRVPGNDYYQPGEGHFNPIQPSARREAVADLTEGDGVEIAVVTSIEEDPHPQYHIGGARGGEASAAGSSSPHAGGRGGGGAGSDDDENDEDTLLHVATLRAREAARAPPGGSSSGARPSERDDDAGSVSDASEVGGPLDAEEVCVYVSVCVDSTCNMSASRATYRLID